MNWIFRQNIWFIKTSKIKFVLIDKNSFSLYSNKVRSMLTSCPFTTEERGAFGRLFLYTHCAAHMHPHIYMLRPLFAHLLYITVDHSCTCDTMLSLNLIKHSARV